MRKTTLMALSLLLLLCLSRTASGTESQDLDLPQIFMYISENEQKKTTACIDDFQTWAIYSDLPENLNTFKGFTITQTLDPCLDYVQNSLSVSAHSEKNTDQLLVMGVHYNLVSGTVAESGQRMERISISLTQEGREYITAGGFTQIRIRYQAAINKQAFMGMQVTGVAQLDCIDPSGASFQRYSDKAVVYTGGFRIRLTDSTGEPCPGGVFMVARPISEAERSCTTMKKELLDIGEEVIAVLYERFYGTENLDGEKTDQVITGPDGTAVVYGLAYGTYYLVQIQAPPGKEPLMLPVKVEVNEISHLKAEDGWQDGHGNAVDHTVKIINGGIVLPETGGEGTLKFTVSGITVLCSACFLLWTNRKRKNTA